MNGRQYSRFRALAGRGPGRSVQYQRRRWRHNADPSLYIWYRFFGLVTMSDMTLTKVLRDNGLAELTTVHGLRSTYRDCCAETGKPRELAEAALAHVVPGVEGAYFRSDLFERR